MTSVRIEYCRGDIMSSGRNQYMILKQKPYKYMSRHMKRRYEQLPCELESPETGTEKRFPSSDENRSALCVPGLRGPEGKRGPAGSGSCGSFSKYSRPNDASVRRNTDKRVKRSDSCADRSIGENGCRHTSKCGIRSACVSFLIGLSCRAAKKWRNDTNTETRAEPLFFRRTNHRNSFYVHRRNEGG